MFGEKHDIPHEFPEYKDLINKLREENNEFQVLYQDYHALDNEIRKIEQNVEAVSDLYAEELKKKRVLLKDKIYSVLNAQAGT